MDLSDSERNDAIRAAFESAADRLPEQTTLEAFAAAAAGWDCHPVRVGGRIVGAVLSHGPEMHACVKPEAFKRWITRELLALVDATAQRFGRVHTRAGTEAGRRFVQRLGFVQDPSDTTLFVKVSHGH
jgi:hypothetical protein